MTPTQQKIGWSKGQRKPSEKQEQALSTVVCLVENYEREGNHARRLEAICKETRNCLITVKREAKRIASEKDYSGATRLLRLLRFSYLGCSYISSY